MEEEIKETERVELPPINSEQKSVPEIIEVVNISERIEQTNLMAEPLIDE